MSPIFVFALAVLLGFQTGCMVVSHYYRRQIADRERTRELELMRHATRSVA